MKLQGENDHRLLRSGSTTNQMLYKQSNIDNGVFKGLHEYSSIIGPSNASHTQNNSVFRYFFCNASYTPRMEHDGLRSAKQNQKRGQ